MINEILKKRFLETLRQPHFADHSPLFSRRNLLKMGVLQGAAFCLPKVAFAQTLKTPTVPFLVFDLAGGAGLPANFLVGKAGGPEDLCANYREMGWNPRVDALDFTYGLPMVKEKQNNIEKSRILAGMREALPEVIKDNEKQSYFKMVGMPHFSLDDTSTNKSSALTYISKIGLKGSRLSQAVGMVNSESGGNSASALDEPQFKPKTLSSLNDILTLTSLGQTFDGLPLEQKNIILDMLLKSDGLSQELQEIYGSLKEMGTPFTEGDPSRDPIMTQIYGNNINLEAAVVYNVLKGFTGPGVITIGGCDYHDGTQNTGDNKDLQIGRSIGRAIRAAYELKTPLFFQIITDGGVYAPSSDNYERRWLGDSNQRSMSVMGYYSPQGGVELMRTQLGKYNNNGLVDLEDAFSKNPAQMVQATVANYLQICGISPDGNLLGLNNSNLDQLLCFG